MAGGYIYILGSHTGTLYIGVSSNLYRRVMQHKQGTLKGFTAAYGCKRLLYFEGYEDIRTAIAREKQLKGWRREKKLNLICTINPDEHPARIPPEETVLGFGGRKGSNSMGKISSVGVLRLCATEPWVTR